MWAQSPARKPHSSRFSGASIALAVMSLSLAGVMGCDAGPSDEEKSERPRSVFTDRLAPGEYRGAVMNESHKLSLDTLACELDTASVTIHLPDDDLVDLRLTGMQEGEDEVWTLRGINDRTGDEWSVRIRR
ncbi:MAG: hypothetical protein RL760_174 [Candidatus Eisenbacteria bacterium]